MNYHFTTSTANKNKIAISVTLCTVVAFAAVFYGCTEQPSTNIGTRHLARSYILPSTVQTFDAGQLHNAEILYIFSHYDSTQYAGFPNKFSESAVDSLAALFIRDSLQTETGSLTSEQISEVDAVFDSVFSASLSTLPNHAQLVASIDTAVAHGFLASDEGDFIIDADSKIRPWSTFAETNDSISSLISQYNLKTWDSSASRGMVAYEYLNVANASCHLWGGPSGNGGSGDPVLVAAHPMADDAEVWAETYTKLEDEKDRFGYTEEQIVAMCNAAASAASLAAGTGNGGGGGGGNGGGGGDGGAWISVAIFIVGIFLLFG